MFSHINVHKYTYIAMKLAKRLQCIESVHEYNGSVDTKFCPGNNKQLQFTKLNSIRLKSYQSAY